MPETVYELFPDGVAICWYFESRCIWKGQCHDCPEAIAYDNSFLVLNK